MARRRIESDDEPRGQRGVGIGRGQLRALHRALPTGAGWDGGFARSDTREYATVRAPDHLRECRAGRHVRDLLLLEFQTDSLFRTALGRDDHRMFDRGFGLAPGAADFAGVSGEVA